MDQFDKVIANELNKMAKKTVVRMNDRNFNGMDPC